MFVVRIATVFFAVGLMLGLGQSHGARADSMVAVVFAQSHQPPLIAAKRLGPCRRCLGSLTNVGMCACMPDCSHAGGLLAGTAVLAVTGRLIEVPSLSAALDDHHRRPDPHPPRLICIG